MGPAIANSQHCGGRLLFATGSMTFTGPVTNNIQQLLDSVSLLAEVVIKYFEFLIFPIIYFLYFISFRGVIWLLWKNF